jgi:hypothetical protein
MADEVVRRPDGVYEEKLSGIWTAEYAEDPGTGLWTVQLFKHDVPEWRETGYATLEECRRGAQEFYDQV